MVEAKKTPTAPAPAAAAPAKHVPTEEEKAAQKAKEAAQEALEKAQDRVNKINANLVKEGTDRRIMANIRNGEPSYFWANQTPTAALTEEELEAVEAMK